MENTCFQHELSILVNIVIVVSNILGPLAPQSSTLSVNFGINLYFPACLCWKMQNKEREVRKILLEMFGLCNYFMIFLFILFAFSPPKVWCVYKPQLRVSISIQGTCLALAGPLKSDLQDLKRKTYSKLPFMFNYH